MGHGKRIRNRNGKVTGSVTETLRGQAPAVVNQLLNRIYSGEMSDPDLIRATGMILDRAYGKATQQVDMNVNKKVEVDIRVLHLDALKAAADGRLHLVGEGKPEALPPPPDVLMREPVTVPQTPKDADASKVSYAKKARGKAA